MRYDEYSSFNKYINRELSWLEFNARVLEEAQDKSNPLFERLKFISIVSSNMDEFFMVRVASLRDQILAGFSQPDPAGLTPREQVEKILWRTHQIVNKQYDCYNQYLLSVLKQEGIKFLKGYELTQSQLDYIDGYYWNKIFPVLTPMVVDQSRPFPLILNRSLNIALLLENQKMEGLPVFATVQVPSVLDRLVEIPAQDGVKYFIFLEEIIKKYIDKIFGGHHILTMGCYRITRNADLGLGEEGAEDLLEMIEQSLNKRKWGSVIRLEIEEGMKEELVNILSKELELSQKEIFEIPGPLDLSMLMKFSALPGVDHLKYPVRLAQPSPAFIGEKNIFKAIARQDILVHHPYESFDPVVELVGCAAHDPNVLAIKQTLYRVSSGSPIIVALAEAAKNGKQVTVLVEIKARFDEQNNIIWARRLEKAGCHVIYGLVGLKTHCKVLLIVRRENEGIKRYVHMGTGNYNDVTAKFYTDLGLFTANPYFGADASVLFNMLSGYSKLTALYKVIVAPADLRNKFLALIRRETGMALQGKKACIMAKMNGLVDQEIIEALYEASNAGVEIDLIVRGICCLRPGIEGMSERIRVQSIVGRYLEHSRIYYFYNDGKELIYLSSADWMPRNLDRRVELLFPIEDEKNRLRLKEIIEVGLRDTVKARILNSDGTYKEVNRQGKVLLNSQDYFYQKAYQAARCTVKEKECIQFQPVKNKNSK